MATSGSEPPKFESIDLDAQPMPKCTCANGRDWQTVIRVTGELVLECSTCFAYATCSCCGESIRNLANTGFKCDCIWDIGLGDDGGPKCRAHAHVMRAVSPNEMVVKLKVGDWYPRIGELAYIDHETGEVKVANRSRNYEPKHVVGVVSYVNREDGTCIINLGGKS